MELVSLRCNRDFTSASSYGLGWYKYAIATQWYQFHTTDAWWFSLKMCKHIEAETKWSQFSRQQFQIHFLEILQSCTKPSTWWLDGILPKGPYLPCLRMADRALLAGYHQCVGILVAGGFDWQVPVVAMILQPEGTVVLLALWEALGTWLTHWILEEIGNFLQILFFKRISMVINACL